MVATNINLKIFRLFGMHLLITILTSNRSRIPLKLIWTAHIFLRLLEKYELSGYSMVAIDHESSEPFSFSLDSSESWLENFIKELHMLARDVYIYKRKVPPYFGDRCQLFKEKILNCWVCRENFSESEENSLSLVGKISRMDPRQV